MGHRFASQGMVNRDELIGTIGLPLDGQGGVITTGSKGFITIPFACELLDWYVSADVSGSIVIDVKRSSASIVGGGGNKPTLSGAQNGTAVIAGWTSNLIEAGDVLEFNVDSIATIKKVTLTIGVRKV